MPLCFGSCSLVVLGNLTEFERGVIWLSENLTFDVDAQINLFEVMQFGFCHGYHTTMTCGPQDFKQYSFFSRFFFFFHAFFCLTQCNIRLLGGLISAHVLAKDYSSQLKDGHTFLSCLRCCRAVDL